MDKATIEEIYQKNRRYIDKQCSNAKFFFGLTTSNAAKLLDFPWSGSPRAMAEIRRWMARAHVTATTDMDACAQLFETFHIDDKSKIYSQRATHHLQLSLYRCVQKELEYFQLPEVGLVGEGGVWVAGAVKQWEQQAWDPNKCGELVRKAQERSKQDQRAKAQQALKDAQAAEQRLHEAMDAAVASQTTFWTDFRQELDRQMPDFAFVDVAEAGPLVQGLLGAVDGLGSQAAARTRDAADAIAMWAIQRAHVESLQGQLGRIDAPRRE